MTATTVDTDFIHVFEPGSDPARRPLLLLHGTGGDENDLVPLGRMLRPGAAILSPRGNVLEHGMPRFFRRLAEGVFDMDDLVRRTDELRAFVDGAVAKYDFDRSKLVAVGFSNGANIAHPTMLLHPSSLAGAVLLHAQYVLEPNPLPSLKGRPVFLAAGQADPIVPIGEAQRLADLLTAAGATVTPFWSPGGHALSREDVAQARQWLNSAGLAS